MDEPIELPPWRDVTCHSEGCPNEGIPIRMQCAPSVFCGGGCQQPITDVVEVPDGNES